MSPRTKKLILTAAAIAAVSAPSLGASPVQARQGADDPVGHVRHSGDDDSTTRSSRKCRSKSRSASRSIRSNSRKCRSGRRARTTAPTTATARTTGRTTSSRV